MIFYQKETEKIELVADLEHFLLRLKLDVVVQRLVDYQVQFAWKETKTLYLKFPFEQLFILFLL